MDGALVLIDSVAGPWLFRASVWGFLELWLSQTIRVEVNDYSKIFNATILFGPN
jgi:hypothetical protein